MSIHAPSCSTHDVRNALTELSKATIQMWEENKDAQGRFVNDLSELQRLQLVVAQLESEGRNDQLIHVRQSLAQMQARAGNLYDVLKIRRSEMIKKLNEGTNFLAILQNQLINDRLFEWKNQQKLAQIGVPFDDKDTRLVDIQLEFEFLAEQTWSLHTFACWMMELVKRGPQLTDNNAMSSSENLCTLMDQLTKLLFMLVSQSFVVTVQPDPVLKTQHKFVTEVCLLIGDKLGIRQHLVNANVSVKIVAEEEAKQLMSTNLNHKDLKAVGTISNDFEKMTMDERGHLCAKFNNSKLTRIAHRKPPPKGAAADSKCASMQATDQKYALLFHISPFQLGNFGKFDVWTLTLPLMVTVHGSQDCDAQGAILWQRAFASVSRSPGTTDIIAVSWDDLGCILRHKFALYTGARRHLSDDDLKYLSEKMLVPNVIDQKPITFMRFAKQNLRDDVSFSFWEWFFSIMQLIKQKLLKFWDEGWLVGFISKHDASQLMMTKQHNSFLLRFSDTQTGAISIGFCTEDDNGEKVPFHLAPFTIKDLDQLSLASRILSCPQLKDIKYLYPAIDKEEMLRCFDFEERNKCIPDSPTGYIQSEIVMVAKTCGRVSTAPSIFGNDSPSPLSKIDDWSPSDAVHQSHAMDISEDLASLLTSTGMDTDAATDVETLLGSSFRPFAPDQHNMQHQQPLHHQQNLQFIGMNGMHPMNQYYPQE